MIAPIVLILSVLGALGGTCPDSDSVKPPTGCDPNSVTTANLDVCLPKKNAFFGVSIRAAPDVPDWAFTYASNVLARYLDSNGDGQADDPKLVQALTGGGSKLGFAVLKCRGSIGSGKLKDSWFGIARTEAQDTLASGDKFQAQVIEEFHHGIYHGFEMAYPTVFGGTGFVSSGASELSAAIMQSYGNCELLSACVVARDCKHYTCNYAGEVSCQFKTGSCDGVFHYAVPSCDNGCLETEGFYHAWTTAYGYKCGGKAGEMASEWELCTAASLASNPKAAKLHELVTGKAASQKTLGYVLPSVLPDGTYNAPVITATASPTVAKPTANGSMSRKLGMGLAVILGALCSTP